VIAAPAAGIGRPAGCADAFTLSGAKLHGGRMAEPELDRRHRPEFANSPVGRAGPAGSAPVKRRRNRAGATGVGEHRLPRAVETDAPARVVGARDRGRRSGSGGVPGHRPEMPRRTSNPIPGGPALRPSRNAAHAALPGGRVRGGGRCLPVEAGGPRAVSRATAWGDRSMCDRLFSRPACASAAGSSASWRQAVAHQAADDHAQPIHGLDRAADVRRPVPGPAGIQRDVQEQHAGEELDLDGHQASRRHRGRIERRGAGEGFPQRLLQRDPDRAGVAVTPRQRLRNRLAELALPEHHGAARPAAAFYVNPSGFGAALARARKATLIQHVMAVRLPPAHMRSLYRKRANFNY